MAHWIVFLEEFQFALFHLPNTHVIKYNKALMDIDCLDVVFLHICREVYVALLVETKTLLNA